MATSSALSTNNKYIKYKITVTQNSQSISNNTSNVTVSVKFYRTNTGYTTYGTGTVYCKINGTTYTASVDTSDKITSSGIVLFSKTLNISHNTDGSKTLKTSAWISHSQFSSSEQSYSQVLTTIPRASSVTCTTANIGSNATIKISRASSSFTHTLTYSFGTLSGTIATKTSSTSISWTIPTSFYEQIPNSTSSTGTITCTTYSGSTSVGSKTCSFKATTSSSTCAPTLSPSVSDNIAITTGLTGDSSKFIKYYSNAAFSIGASARNGATIKSQKVTCGAKSSTSSSGTLSAVESATFVFSATDSRGYTTSQTVTKTLINYVKLTCTFKANALVDGTATIKVDGNYFNGSFGSVSNTLTVQYRYKVSGGSFGSWTNLSATKSGHTYTASGSLSGLDYTKSYVFQARAVDKLATVTTGEKTVRALPVFDWGENDFNFNVIAKSSYTDVGFRQVHGTTGADIGFGIGGGGQNRGIYDYTLNKWIFYTDGSTTTMGNTTNATLTSSGATSIKGNDVSIYSAAAGVNYRPYYRAGDKITISTNIHTAGFITNSGKTLCFIVPLDKPILGSPTITVTSNDGFIVRQINSYLYDSDASTYVKPSSYVTGFSAFGIRINAVFNNTTNVTNNSSCGITWNGVITLS